MAKSKARPPGKPRAPNPHLYARISFLYQSAQFLSRPSPYPSANPTINTSANTPLSRFYLSTARIVAKKSVLRLSPSLKRTICKRCDAYLIPGTTSTHRIENNSRGGRKPWADVLVIACNGCGAVKRFPVGMEAKKEPEWKLWGEKLDVVVGCEEEKDVAEVQRADVGKGQKRGMCIDGTEGSVHQEAGESGQQSSEDTMVTDVAKADT